MQNVANQPRGFFASAELALCTPGMSKIPVHRGGVKLWGACPEEASILDFLGITIGYHMRKSSQFIF
jgi:hypothetical protein